MLTSTKLAPTRALSAYVAHIRVFTDLVEPARYERLPDGQVELIVRQDADGASIKVMGTRSTPLHKASEPAREVLQVRFKPGAAYPFVGVPLSELTDRIVFLADLWPHAANGFDQALCATSLGDRVAALERALRQRLVDCAFEPASVPTVRRALRFLHARPQLPRIHALAADLGVSERQLRRAFAEVVGVTPKIYLRVLRFQRALRAAKHAPQARWSMLARAPGYFDQAHMISEFRALGGGTPQALRARRAS